MKAGFLVRIAMILPAVGILAACDTGDVEVGDSPSRRAEVLAAGAEVSLEAPRQGVPQPERQPPEAEGAGADLQREGAAAPAESTTQGEPAAVDAGPSLAARVREKVTELAADTSKALDSVLSAETLQKVAASLSVEKLKEIAVKIREAIHDREATVQDLRNRLARLSTSLVGKEASELRKALSEKTADLELLRDKLAVLLEKLVSSDVDVAEFRGFLEGK